MPHHSRPATSLARGRLFRRVLFSFQLTNKFAVGNEVERDKTAGITVREAQESAQGDAEARAPFWPLGTHHFAWPSAEALAPSLPEKKKKKKE